LQGRIKDTFANSSNAAIIRAVSTIFGIALQDTRRMSFSTTSVTTTRTMDEVVGPGLDHLRALDELGMQGLAGALSFVPMGRDMSQCVGAMRVIQCIPDLVVRIIE
jgi:hypothetical protein